LNSLRVAGFESVHGRLDREQLYLSIEYGSQSAGKCRISESEWKTPTQRETRCLAFP
jgi:hypothetical protein